MGVNTRRIKAYRAYNEIGQKEVAEALGVSITTYSQKEQGILDFSSKEIGKLAEIFNVPPGDLFSQNKQLL